MSYLREFELVSCYSYPKGRVKIFSLLFHPHPSFPALGRLEYTYWKGGDYPLFITGIHSTECSTVAVVAGGK